VQRGGNPCNVAPGEKTRKKTLGGNKQRARLGCQNSEPRKGDSLLKEGEFYGRRVFWLLANQRIGSGSQKNTFLESH